MTRENILRRIDEIDSLIKEQESKKQNSMILMIVMVIVFWPLLFLFLGDMNKAEAQIAELNKEKRELEARLREGNFANNNEEDVIDATNVSSTSVDPTTRLKELKDLYEDDCISEEEYQALKAKVLKDLK
jgi:biopolymer transport protein ExbB/TolQ